jgi:hypothetical protein
VARKTGVERRLIAYLKEQYGEHLGTLLLSGHRVKGWVRRRDLVISTADRVGNREERPVTRVCFGFAGGLAGRSNLPLVSTSGRTPAASAYLKKMSKGGLFNCP